MIFCNCPHCDKSKVVEWEAGDGHTFIPFVCDECSEVYWVELASIGGETRSHDSFKKEIVEPERHKEVDDIRDKVRALSG